MKIEALHQFHDKIFSEEWSNKFKPTPERIEFFQMIMNNLRKENNQSLSILELGIGPGYMAEHILSNCKDVIYEGLDFSEAMIEIAKERLQSISKRIQFTQTDLTDHTWIKQVKTKPQNIISTWALHDLLNNPNISTVYKLAYKLLPQNARLINDDFIKPENSIFEYEKGRIKPSEHIELLNQCGFKKVECLKIFEVNEDNPTTSNNYACFVANNQ